MKTIILNFHFLFILIVLLPAAACSDDPERLQKPELPEHPERNNLSFYRIHSSNVGGIQYQEITSLEVVVNHRAVPVHVKGGTPPYSFISRDESIATVVPAEENGFIIKSCQAGNVALDVTDSKGEKGFLPLSLNNGYEQRVVRNHNVYLDVTDFDMEEMTFEEYLKVTVPQELLPERTLFLFKFEEPYAGSMTINQNEEMLYSGRFEVKKYLWEEEEYVSLLCTYNNQTIEYKTNEVYASGVYTDPGPFFTKTIVADSYLLMVDLTEEYREKYPDAEIRKIVGVMVTY